tara:strand:- start:469 stop:1677 length:1209 start_codon:yes stop_codon:yes gene_type:complete
MSINKKGKQNIFTSFDGTNVPEDFEFPSQGIEDIDRAIFNFFDKNISFETEQKGKSRKIPVVFASGERFALTRRKNPIRDKNNALILPIISIIRKDIDISASQHNLGTPISFMDQPGYYIKRRLSKQDRKYQNIVNKQGVKNQKNVTSRNNFQNNTVSPGDFAKPGTVSSRRNSNGLSYYAGNNINLDSNLGNNIFEIIEIPYPQFAAIKYDVIFWAQYLKESNNMLQTLFRSFTGQAQEIMITTEKGYELVLKFGETFNIENNFDNYSDEERIIKHSIEITVPGYIISPDNKGMPNQIRSYFSAPKINFGYHQVDSKVVFQNELEKKDQHLNKFLLSDLRNENDRKEVKRGETSEDIQHYIENPFTGNREVKFSKVLSRNSRKGETVFSSLLVSDLERQHE